MDYVRKVSLSCKHVYVVFEIVDAANGKHGSALCPSDFLVRMTTHFLHTMSVGNVTTVLASHELDSQALGLMHAGLASHAIVLIGDNDLLIMPPCATTIFNAHFRCR